jgi:hypothetical protein
VVGNSSILINSLKLYHSKGRFFHALVHLLLFDAKTFEHKASRACKIHLTADNNTTIGVEGLSSNGRAVGRSQEDKASGDLRRLRGTADRAGEF